MLPSSVSVNTTKHSHKQFRSPKYSLMYIMDMFRFMAQLIFCSALCMCWMKYDRVVVDMTRAVICTALSYISRLRIRWNTCHNLPFVEITCVLCGENHARGYICCAAVGYYIDRNSIFRGTHISTWTNDNKGCFNWLKGIHSNGLFSLKKCVVDYFSF